MNRPPARPRLATITCIYLVVTAFIPMPTMWILIWGWFHSVFIYDSTLRTPFSLVVCALAIAGAITVWQMRRAAFFLLAVRFILSMALLVIIFPRSLDVFHRVSAISRSVANLAMRLGLAGIVTEWLLNALIVWYVYRITAPRRFSPGPTNP